MTSPSLTSAPLWREGDGGITDGVEPTSQQTAATTADDAIADALRAFVCALGPAAAEVRLEFAGGGVTLTGAVASDTQRQAVEDLLAAHDGVTNVICELRVAAPGVVASGF